MKSRNSRPTSTPSPQKCIRSCVNCCLPLRRWARRPPNWATIRARLRLTLHNVLTQWNVGPFALLVLATCVAAAVWYLQSVWALSAKGRTWSRRRTTAFLVGLVLVDLALPRDIEPEAASVGDVYVYNLDDLAKIAETNLARRRAEVAKCRAILAERTAQLWPAVSHSLNQPPAPKA